MKLSRRAFFGGLVGGLVVAPAFAVPDMRHSPAYRDDLRKRAAKIKLNSEYGRMTKRTFYIDVGSLPPDQAVAHMRKVLARYA
jgi:hypothetical protein